MTARTAPSPSLAASLTAAATAALAELALDRPDYQHVVTWISADSAALERVVYPAARRHLRAARPAIDRLAALTRRVEHATFELHQWLSGDGRVGAVDLPASIARLRSLLEESLSGHSRLAEDLASAVTTKQWECLVKRHARAVASAPSRPHPHIPHSGPAERIAFVIAGTVDRLIDALESRTVAPVPVAVTQE